MSRSIFGLVAIGALLFVLQRTVFLDVKFFGVYLDLLLLFAVCAGISGGADRGAVAGFTAGLAQDSFLISPLGLCAFAFAVAGFVAGAVSDETTKLPGVVALTAGSASALALLLVLVFGHITGVLRVPASHGFAVLFVASLANAVFAPTLCRVMRTLARREREPAW